MSRIFDLDFKKLAILLTPTFLRMPAMLAWLHSLVTPLEDVHDDFVKRRAEDIYRLDHTAQVVSLEKVLNDHFDISLRRIRIGDVERKEPFYIFSEAEKTPSWMSKQPQTDIYLFAENMTVRGGTDFVVVLPPDVWNAQKTAVGLGEYRFYAIEALLDFYRLAGKKYRIILG